MYIISIFLALHFDENFMKIGIKIPKLQIHENLHKNVNENMWKHFFIHIFMHTFISIYDICYSFTLLISYNMGFNPFKMAVQFFWIASKLPKCFSPSSTDPWPWLQKQKSRKIPVLSILLIQVGQLSVTDKSMDALKLGSRVIFSYTLRNL